MEINMKVNGEKALDGVKENLHKHLAKTHTLDRGEKI
jgi:hypothetical protein